jgi:citrate lyase subunit beta/citryl-CoA lyase
LPIARPRSLFYAPANRPDLIAKMTRFAPDAAILDLEDGTPGDEKISARALAAEAATKLRPQFPGSIWLRVNAPRDDLIEGDLDVVSAGPFDGIVVPKVERVDDVERIERRLGKVASNPIAVMWGFETVLGTRDCRRILEASTLAVAAFFGAEDYIADLRGRRTPSSLETLYPRSKVATACRLRGIVAIDQVVLAINDPERFRRDAQDGLALGYRGKNCIHPSQVPLCAEVYSPTEQEVARARRLLAAYDDAVAASMARRTLRGR